MDPRPVNGVTRDLIAAFASAQELLESAKRLLEIAGNRVYSFELGWSGGPLAGTDPKGVGKTISRLVLEVEKCEDDLRRYHKVLFDEKNEVVPYKYQG